MPGAVDDVVLCVDDEVVILMALRAELRRRFEGRFRIETAAGANEAIIAAERLKKDGSKLVLTITDWTMPGMRGDQLVMKLRKIWPDMKALLITGQDDDTTDSQACASGLFDARLSKPWRPETLSSLIASCLDVKNLDG